MLWSYRPLNSHSSNNRYNALPYRHKYAHLPISYYNLSLIVKFPAMCIGTNITSYRELQFRPVTNPHSENPCQYHNIFLGYCQHDYSYPQLLRHHPMLRKDQFPGDNTMHLFSIVRHDIRRGVTYTSISPWLDQISFIEFQPDCIFLCTLHFFTLFPTV